MSPGGRHTKAVLFDLDDTLFDHRHCCRCGLAALRETTGSLRSVPLDRLERDYQHWLDELHESVLLGQLSLEKARVERFKRLLRQYGERPTAQRVLTVEREYQHTYRRSYRAVPGARELLEQLKPAAHIAVVSNNLILPQQEKLSVCGLASFVDELVVSEEVGKRKPDAAIFDIALARVSCTPDVAVMVGDRWEVDILGARAAGIRAVWFNRTGAACPDPLVASEIPGLEPVDRVVDLLLRLG